MIKFECFYNSVENSEKSIYVKENPHEINEAVFNMVYEWFEQSVETAIECASWAELATDFDDWVNNDITVICRVID